MSSTEGLQKHVLQPVPKSMYMEQNWLLNLKTNNMLHKKGQIRKKIPPNQGFESQETWCTEAIIIYNLYSCILKCIH